MDGRWPPAGGGSVRPAADAEDVDVDEDLS
jgi:hypothetical protein